MTAARPTSIKEFERRARDRLGLTRAEAKMIAAVGWPLMGRCDASEPLPTISETPRAKARHTERKSNA